jgi:hypothetical protein
MLDLIGRCQIGDEGLACWGKDGKPGRVFLCQKRIRGILMFFYQEM